MVLVPNLLLLHMVYLRVLFLVPCCILFYSSTLFSYSLFADDTSLLLVDKKAVDLLLIANQEIQKWYAWYRCNKLLVNVQKTKCVIFSSRVKSFQMLLLFLILEAMILRLVKMFNFLGLTMDGHLSWKNHLYVVCTKLSRSVGVNFRLKFISPERVLITLYKSIILP